MKIRSILIAATFMGVMAIPSANAIPTVAKAEVSQASDVQTVARRGVRGGGKAFRGGRAFRGGKAFRGGRAFRGGNGYRYRQHRNYQSGYSYRSAPYGYRRYYSRPYNWESRGCIIVGPVWFCP